MKKLLILIGLSISLFLTVPVAAQCRPLAHSKEELKNFNFVIVPGLANEFLAFYMTEYRQYLLRAGVPKEQIFRFNNSSFNDPLQESKKLLKKVRALSKNSKTTKKPADAATNSLLEKKIVILAHSKGALESLYMLKDYPLDQLERAYLIQGPFDGAESYELLYKSEQELTHYLTRLLLKIKKIPFVEKRYSKFSKKIIRKNLAPILKRPELLKKLVFVPTETVFTKLPFKMRIAGGMYFESYHKVGDGVLLKKNQTPHALQTDLTCIKELEASHDLLVKASPWQWKRVARIHKFLDSLLL